MTENPQLVPYVKENDVADRRARQVTSDILTSTNQTATTTEEASSSRRASFLEQDEGVLMDVLEELDKERQKRAELEAKVRVLEQEAHTQRKKSSKSSKLSSREFAVVKAERDGFKEILDALIQDRPAFSTSSYKSQQKSVHQTKSLPIHIVRLLEVMPWDSRAQQYIFGQEQVYEWQIYSADKKWQKELRYFPTFFKTLPIVMPTQDKTMSDDASKSQPYFGVPVSPPKQCVLTDLDGATILNIDKGYPLPDDGGLWTWVGPWKVEKNIDTDEDGWTYSNETEIMSDLSTYYGEFKIPEKGTANIAKRRRKWIRPRTLIDYPYASNMTREYLNLIADRSRLDASCEKLSGQLVETKMRLTTLEEEKERNHTRLKELEHNLHLKDGTPGFVENGDSSEPSKKVDEIRSAVTQWVSNTVQKQLQNTNDENTNKLNSMMTEFHDGSEESATAQSSDVGSSIAVTKSAQQQKQQEPKQQLFESLRDKGTGFFESFKQKGEQVEK